MRIAAAILILLAVAVFAYWGATGAHFVTVYQVPKVTMVEDEFGDQVEKHEMVDEFQFGLNPTDKYIDGALPIGGTLGGLGLGLLVFDLLRRRKKA